MAPSEVSIKYQEGTIGRSVLTQFRHVITKQDYLHILIDESKYGMGESKEHH